MPALVAGIHVFHFCKIKDVDGRNKSGHDDLAIQFELVMRYRRSAAKFSKFLSFRY
jgi:hypothetical protein